MRGYNFTESVRAGFARAREEAMALGQEYVGTEHMLLGIVAQDKLTTVILQNLGVDPVILADQTRAAIHRGGVQAGTRPDLPYTSRAKKVIELAMEEARELNHAYVGTEHVLMGLLREEKGIAAQMLHSFGVTVARARAEMLVILGVEPPDARIAVTPPTDEHPHSIAIVLRYPSGAVITRSFPTAREAATFLAGQ